jgi:hypothetical protein
MRKMLDVVRATKLSKSVAEQKAAVALAEAAQANAKADAKVF